MDTFNRLVAVFTFSVVLLAVAYVAIWPFPALEQAQLRLTNLEESLAGRQADNPTNFVVAQAAVAIAALLLFGTLIGMEVMSGRRRGVRIRTAEGGSVELDTESVARRLAWKLDQLAEVVSVVPSVKSRGGSVDIRLEVETAPDVDVPMKTDEVVDVTRDMIEQDMGLKLGKLDVLMRYAPYDSDWA